jgi:hypothetical protein
MPKYLITWNAGYGKSNEVGEFATQDEATDYAYEMWREEAENNSDYQAEILTPELAEEHGFEDELDDENKEVE